MASDEFEPVCEECDAATRRVCHRCGRRICRFCANGHWDSADVWSRHPCIPRRVSPVQFECLRATARGPVGPALRKRHARTFDVLLRSKLIECGENKRLVLTVLGRRILAEAPPV